MLQNGVCRFPDCHHSINILHKVTLNVWAHLGTVRCNPVFKSLVLIITVDPPDQRLSLQLSVRHPEGSLTPSTGGALLIGKAGHSAGEAIAAGDVAILQGPELSLLVDEFFPFACASLTLQGLPPGSCSQ